MNRTLLFQVLIVVGCVILATLVGVHGRFSVTTAAYAGPIFTPGPIGSPTPCASTFSLAQANLVVTDPCNPTPFPTQPAPTATPTVTPAPQAWKGIGDPGLIDAGPGDGFWGVYPAYWYNWGTSGYYKGRSARSRADILAGLESGLQNPNYVPMIFCPDDVQDTQPTPAQAAALAKQYPGRVWLMFNEPDNTNGQCGFYISTNHDPNYFASSDWSGLGTYLAQQYIRYYDAIKNPNTGDPTARLFPLGLLTLPMPTLAGVDPNWARAIPIWNAFTDELSRQNRSIDGIAIHAYPNNFSSYHSGCNTGSVGYVDYACVTSALKDAHDFFQGMDSNPSKNWHPEMTKGKEIWITEIGSLTTVTEQPWSITRDQFENNIVTWLNSHSKPNQDAQYINVVFWFSTHFKRSSEDYTASNLLNHLVPTQKQLTEVGQAWRDAVCDQCACPGPDCQ